MCAARRLPRHAVSSAAHGALTCAVVIAYRMVAAHHLSATLHLAVCFAKVDAVLCAARLAFTIGIRLEVQAPCRRIDAGEAAIAAPGTIFTAVDAVIGALGNIRITVSLSHKRRGLTTVASCSASRSAGATRRTLLASWDGTGRGTVLVLRAKAIRDAKWSATRRATSTTLVAARFAKIDAALVRT